MAVQIAPTTEEIINITKVAEPVLRNLKITQCYYELSAVFAQRIGPGANWCTFATWASKQAGQTIRRQDLENHIKVLLKNEPEIEAALSVIVTIIKRSGAQQTIEQLRESTLGSIVSSVAKRASEAVSRGNKKVFEEIGYEFSRFMSACLNDKAYVQSHIHDFCQQLHKGLPPDGQDYLQQGFTNYYQALFEDDPKKKTQLNFFANLLIGYHEQNRLQPEITEALNAAVVNAQQVKNQLLSKLSLSTNLSTRFKLFFQRFFSNSNVLDKAIELLVQRVQYHLRRILTAHLMTLTLPPDNCLHLGRNLSMTYPEDLMELANPALLTLLKKIDITPNSLLESGATDWANLEERMHYITDLFRCYHESNDLFSEAFTTEQVTAIKNGKIPQGNL